MTPQQKFYWDIMKNRGWLTEDGTFAWPSDERERRAMARQVFGLELVSWLDYQIKHADDEVCGTFEAAWANPERVPGDAAKRRAIFATLTPEQKAAVLDLVRHFGKSFLFCVCCQIDQFHGGGITMQLSGTNPNDPKDELRFQPGDFLDMHDELLQWLEDFSQIFGDRPEE